jgi:AcrR family transcriptional regulator
VAKKYAGKSADDRETTGRLLDSAERLFAEHGYDGVGMRALASDAGVNLGAVTYHFGSKERLYVETFMRRFRPVNAARLELLREAEASAKGKALRVETIVDCLMRPPFLTVLAHPRFPALLARNLFMPPPFMRVILEKEVRLSLGPFARALSKSLPKLSMEMLMLRLMFSGGALLMVAAHLGGPGKELGNDPEAIKGALGELVRFVSAGLRSESVFPGGGVKSLFGPLRPPRV